MLAAEPDLVITCVTGSPQMEAIVYGDDGIPAGAHKRLVIADCTTADPNTTARIAADIGKAGARLVDAPLTRMPKEAEAGTLAIMIGGDPDTIVEIRPALECFADKIVRAGDVGAGHRMKLNNNFVALGTVAIVAEGICAADKAGVDMKALEAVVMSGRGGNVMFNRLMRLVIDDDDSHAKFAIANAEEDLCDYIDLTRAMPVTSPMAEMVHQT